MIEIIMFILKLLLLIFILGIIILVHEFGHFIWAKKFGVYIYEFSIGMGPLLHTHKGKDGIDYNIRWIPIGGYVSMAGEVYDDDEKIPKKKLLCNKPWWQRLIILCAGVFNNFILAILLLILYSSIWGGSAINPVVLDVVEDYPAMQAGIKKGDTILKIDDHKITSWDKGQIILHFDMYESKEFEVKHEDGTIEKLIVTPQLDLAVDGKTEVPVIGIYIENADTSNPLKVLGYSFAKFGSIISSMFWTIYGLIIGKISLGALSGPVGIYGVVGQAVNYDFGVAIAYLVNLLALLSINTGFINILPFPAFDGGHVFFLLVEKIKGSPVNSKFENVCHLIGFGLIFLLMIVVTISDIIKLF